MGIDDASVCVCKVNAEKMQLLMQYTWMTTHNYLYID